MLDTKKLVVELKSLATTLKASKKAYNTRYRDWKVIGDLQGLKARATQLCALRAHGRGRVHCQNRTLEQQEAFLTECGIRAEFEVAELLTETPQPAPEPAKPVSDHDRKRLPFWEPLRALLKGAQKVG